MPSTDWIIEVDGLKKSFGAEPALKGVSLRIAPGERVALLGASEIGRAHV